MLSYKLTVSNSSFLGLNLNMLRLLIAILFSSSLIMDCTGLERMVSALLFEGSSFDDVSLPDCMKNEFFLSLTF